MPHRPAPRRLLRHSSLRSSLAGACTRTAEAKGAAAVAGDAPVAAGRRGDWQVPRGQKIRDVEQKLELVLPIIQRHGRRVSREVLAPELRDFCPGQGRGGHL